MAHSNLRIVGVDDGSSNRKVRKNALLLVVLFNGVRIEAVRVGKIKLDGNDAAEVLQRLLRKLTYDLVLLSGISFGGFNVIDISKLSRDLHKPIIVIIGEKPNNTAVKAALRDHFEDWKIRWKRVSSAGRLHSCKPLRNEPKLFFEIKGNTPQFARQVIIRTAIVSRLPEPIRIARLLAKGLSPFTDFINA